MSKPISFWVPGIPAPGGSKKFVGLSKFTNRAILIDAGGKRNKDWRAAVAEAARVAYRGEPMDCLLQMKITFYLPRPKRHYDRLGLRENAPVWHSIKPDTTKLVRSTEDAMTGIVYRDDACIVCQQASKRYIEEGTHPGAMITIQVML